MGQNNQRMCLDCRKMKSEKNCDVFMSGSKEHLMEAAVGHAVKDHGHMDTPEMRAEIEKIMEPAEQREA